MAIIVVDRSIEFSPKAMPICLPNNDNDEVFWNKIGIVAGECWLSFADSLILFILFEIGWGETGTEIERATLMETKVHVLPTNICYNELSKIGINYNDMAMMCANEEFSGTCQVCWMN